MDSTRSASARAEVSQATTRREKGLFGFASVPGLITRVTDHARGVPLAASANVSASNIANALGAWLGGFAISVGLGYTAPLYVGAAIVLIGLAVMLVAARRSGRSEPVHPEQRPR
ncbi:MULTISPECIES: hypothetical protein [unclassified Streptomyces]|uniref:hypothetical protein n=1 Tax=unclassified Streptomyces TaxID=2593676 RepID=UPI00386315BE